MIPPERQPVTTGFFGYNKPISPSHREGDGAERGGARGRPALHGMYDRLIPSMAILGVFIPSPGGVIMADFFIREQGRSPVIGEAVVPPGTTGRGSQPAPPSWSRASGERDPSCVPRPAQAYMNRSNRSLGTRQIGQTSGGSSRAQR